MVQGHPLQINAAALEIKDWMEGTIPTPRLGLIMNGDKCNKHALARCPLFGRSIVVL